MVEGKKIGVIGLGNMGAAVAIALRKQVPSQSLYLSNRSQKKVDDFIDQYGGKSSTNEEIIRTCDWIFLAVKPKQLHELVPSLKTSYDSSIKKQIFVSMMAGVDLKTLTKTSELEPAPWIRMMPNTPVAIGQGLIAYSLNEQAKKLQVGREFEDLLSQGGGIYLIEETLMDAFSGLAGCGPAFVYQFIEAMSDAGVKNGIPRALAIELAAKTVAGAAQMVTETDKHPAVLKDEVCSPGGSTIEGVSILEKQHFRGTVIEAIDGAVKKTKELGK
ncbi:pyrroline-5-carboxylate reductase [Granulicatella seriolae]|uniref:Pyrroline-5-carboxylate reductase n=1 Tax=Granulicatella seriolae TaxID=2967226 RepID=A0ABT1WL52_9LACT|nr:pyrroline-5-carboxylate reductase [Granulicatella seriolae]